MEDIYKQKSAVILNFSNNLNLTSSSRILSSKISSNFRIFNSKVINVKEKNIISCLSCKNCFLGYKCYLDNLDDMVKIKKIMTESDLIFFITPVYGMNISSIMSKVIERISYWLHDFRLAGKQVVLIVITDRNSGKYVLNYLEFISNSLGLQTIAKMSIKSHQVNNNDFLQRAIKLLEEKIRIHYSSSTSYTNKEMEFLFSIGKNDITNIDTERKKEMFKYDTLNDYILNERRKKDEKI